jgi:organic radical activating enzyme
VEDDNINLKYRKIKDQLDTVSPSFCLAKWKQVTVHLDTGRTHSCHHPVTHKIPVSEIKKNPSALHNTEFKKQQRKLMLEGQRPEECDYCWRVEDSAKDGIESYSDRIVKSASSWAEGTFDDVIKYDWRHNSVPSSLEVNFGSICNFKCSYCNPEISSKWMEEVNQHGGYVLPNLVYNSPEWLAETDRVPIPNRKYNPYVEAFWQWWPDIVDEIRVFRITGGEPLLNKNTFKVLDYLIDNPKPELHLSVNSNLCVPDNLLNEFVSKLQIIQDKKAIGSFKMYTSCEAQGARAEYIRYGLDYNKWLANCETIVRDIPNSRLGLMSTYNLLSVTSFKDMLVDMLRLKNEYTIQPQRPHTVSIDIPYLRWPEFMVPWLIAPDWLTHIEDTVTWMYHNLQQTYWPPLCGKGFFDHEIKKMERIYVVCKESMNDSKLKSSIKVARKNFIAFVDEHDRRRGTDFLNTFPEFEQYYSKWSR